MPSARIDEDARASRTTGTDNQEKRRNMENTSKGSQNLDKQRQRGLYRIKPIVPANRWKGTTTVAGGLSIVPRICLAQLDRQRLALHFHVRSVRLAVERLLGPLRRQSLGTDVVLMGCNRLLQLGRFRGEVQRDAVLHFQVGFLAQLLHLANHVAG